MNALVIYAMIVTGVMNFKPIMKYVSVIGAMDSIANHVTKWINAMIVEKLFVEHVAVCYRVNSAEEDCAQIVPQPVENVALYYVQGIPSLQWNVILANSVIA
jgi:hypothetical protein